MKEAIKRYDQCMTWVIIIFGSVAGLISFIYSIIAFYRVFVGDSWLIGMVGV